MLKKNNNALDFGNTLIGVFLDLKKAFNTVDHHILFFWIYFYGVRGKSLNWFESYLNERHQYVSFQGSTSEIEYIKCGVPQRSILGPLLFILYINDLSNVSNVLFPILFADDTSVFIKLKDIITIINTLNSELNKLHIWLHANKLTINISESHYMVFHRGKRKPGDNCILLNNNILAKFNLQIV